MPGVPESERERQWRQMNQYKISEIKLGIDEPIEHIPERIRESLGRKDLKIYAWSLLRESVDARKKNQICRVYSVSFETETISPSIIPFKNASQAATSRL